MPLREYQTKLINEVRQAYKDGFKTPCIVLPCGGGKSVIVAEIAKRTTDKGNKVLFLVHRKELCDQIRATFKNWGVNMNLCLVGMVQTICKRLAKLSPPSLIITDENHHSLATSYKKIYEFFPLARRVGVTATPIRLNGSGLKDVNDKLIIGVTAKWLIEHNYLAPYDYYAPSMIDLTSVKTSRGEYVSSDVERLMIRKAVFGDVIENYRRLADGKQAICYCTTIKHSLAMEKAFNEAGIDARHIDGETPKAERDRIIEMFRSGQINILCNVDLISEGFDVPDCECAILLRPTKSLTLYIQQAMRCMRYKKDKRAVIIDHVGNYARFGLPDEDREWKLEYPKKPKRKKNDVPDVGLTTCPKCFSVLPKNIAVCSECGFKFPKKEIKEIEKEESTLQKIEGFKIDYDSPSDCESYDELLAYANRHGYKRGWAYYQAKSRGML